MNTSEQEKEKLRKKLLKLFQGQENVKGFSTGNGTHNQQSKEIMKDSKTLITSKNKVQHATKDPPMQNIKQGSETNSKKFETEPALKKNSHSTPRKTKEESEYINAKISGTKKESKMKSAEADKTQKKTPISNVQSQSKKGKPITADKLQKKSPKIEMKSQDKLGKKHIKNLQQKNFTKLNQNTLDNNFIKSDNYQTKKVNKRSAPDGALNQSPVSNKKQKFNKKEIKSNGKKVNKNTKLLSDESDCSSQNEIDVSPTTRRVTGGVIDLNYEEDADQEHSYWLQEENSSYDYSDHNSNEHHNWKQVKDYSDDSGEDNSQEHHNVQEENSEPNTTIKRFQKNSNSDSDNFSKSGEEDNDSDDEYEFEYYDSDSFEDDEVEGEYYSEFDEDDYEEEEDNYNYSSDSENEFSSDDDDFESGMSFGFNHDSEGDDDYKLPNHIPEDFLIHSGTATKRDLKPEDNVFFNSDNEESQIVELENQQTVKTIYQPKAYDKQELLKLKYEEKTIKTITFHKKETTATNEAEDCPKLVPIVDDEGFQLYNPNEELVDDDCSGDAIEDEEELEEESMEDYEDEYMDACSLGSEYTEVNSDDASSFLSEDINDKYLKRDDDFSDSDDSVDERNWIQKHKPDIIDATGYECQKTVQNISDHTEENEVILNDDTSQIPSIKLYKHVDLETDCKILSTTIIDNKIHFSNESCAHQLDAKLLEQQKNGEISDSLEEELIAEENCIEKSPKAAKPFTQNIVNYNTKFFNAYNSNLVMVLLKDPFYIYGTVRLTLLAGSMEIYGHSLKLNTEVEIFSPRGCSVIEISALPTNDKNPNGTLKEILKNYEQQFSLKDLKTINELYSSETDAVILLKRNDARKKMVQQFKKFMNENVFPNINNINTDRPLYNSEYLLRCMINTSCQEQKCLRLPQDWQNFSLTSKSRVMLAGGKGVGKSTLLRYLINRHLPQKVLLIDLDIGQPEVFIPQTLSCTIIDQPLLGPGFLLNLQPEISFAVGHTNIALCAHKYLEAVRKLMAYCKEQEAFKDIPWLINTMGYNKGFGLELISVLAQEPLTDVIQLQSSKEINNFESLLNAHVLSSVPHILFSEEYERNKKELKGNWSYNCHIWPSAIQQESRYQKEWEMSPKDLRYAMLLARLSAALQGHADWLTDVKPLKASLNDLKIINLMDNTPLVSAEELEKAIEANLVYLCQYEEDLIKPLKCFGIGVVRAIDFHVRQLYLIPVLPYGQLKDVNCLAIGEMPLPTSLFTNQGPRIKNITPYVYNTVAANASKGVKQIYHRPAKFLTGNHKPLD